MEKPKLTFDLSVEESIKSWSKIQPDLQGNWQLLGRIPDITEEKANTIIRSQPTVMIGEVFFDYTCGKWDAFDSLDSLYSLLQANEVYFENPVKLPDYDMKYMTSRWTYYGADILKHREAQSKVFDKERCYLFIKVD